MGSMCFQPGEGQERAFGLLRDCENFPEGLLRALEHSLIHWLHLSGADGWWMDGCWAALWRRCVMKCAPVIGLLVRERRARAARACAQLARITAATAGTELSRVTRHAESAVNNAAVMTRGKRALVI